jgi:hypothetical protein
MVGLLLEAAGPSAGWTQLTVGVMICGGQESPESIPTSRISIHCPVNTLHRGFYWSLGYVTLLLMCSGISVQIHGYAFYNSKQPKWNCVRPRFDVSSVCAAVSLQFVPFRYLSCLNYGLLGRDSMWSWRLISTFRRKTMSQSSGQSRTVTTRKSTSWTITALKISRNFYLSCLFACIL